MDTLGLGEASTPNPLALNWRPPPADTSVPKTSYIYLDLVLLVEFYSLYSLVTGTLGIHQSAFWTIHFISAHGILPHYFPFHSHD